MKTTTKNLNAIGEQIEEILSNRGFYTLVDCSRKVDSIGSFLAKYIPVLIVIFRLLVSLYYYPRSIQYLLAHPLSEACYLLESLDIYVYLAIGVYLGLGIIGFIIAKILAIKALRIYRQVYNEFGIEAPEFEI